MERIQGEKKRRREERRKGVALLQLLAGWLAGWLFSSQ